MADDDRADLSAYHSSTLYQFPENATYDLGHIFFFTTYHFSATKNDSTKKICVAFDYENIKVHAEMGLTNMVSMF